MRLIKVRIKPIKVFNNPMEAINEAIREDFDMCLLPNDCICGKTIQGMRWSDAGLVFELDDGNYFNITADIDMITCSFSEKPIISQVMLDDDIRLEFDGFAIEWHRGKIVEKFIGKQLERLWFGNDALYIYARGSIIACHLFEEYIERKPWLYWTESD